MPVSSKTDLVLLLLYATDKEGRPNAPVRGITRLEKYVFLAVKESNILASASNVDDQFRFRPYKMGPFSPEVYDEVDFLKALGLVHDAPYKDPSGSAQVEWNALITDQILSKYQKEEAVSSQSGDAIYSLTPKGIEIARRLYENLTPAEREFLTNLKKRFNHMSLREFLRYVYKKYPEYATKSEIKDYLGL